MKAKEIIIRADSDTRFWDLSEILHFRELFFIFAWRDIKVRYKQTFLGVVWVIFQPLISTLIFTFFFGKLARIPSYDIPYSLFVLSGLVYWTFFSNTLAQASTSLVANQNILKKVYFPKIILPLSSIVTNLLDLTINLLFLILFAASLGYFPKTSFLYLIPLSVLIASLSAAGLGLFLSAINAKYRDVGYVLPFFIQMLLFVTPVIYPLAIVAETNKLILGLNPMTTVLDFSRMMFTKEIHTSPSVWIISAVSCLGLFILGLWYFKKTERFFADLI